VPSLHGVDAGEHVRIALSRVDPWELVVQGDFEGKALLQ